MRTQLKCIVMCPQSLRSICAHPPPQSAPTLLLLMYAKCLSLEPYNVVFYVLQATTLDSIGECACLCFRVPVPHTAPLPLNVAIFSSHSNRSRDGQSALLCNGYHSSPSHAALPHIPRSAASEPRSKDRHMGAHIQVRSLRRAISTLCQSSFSRPSTAPPRAPKPLLS
jgi:hypothetical protein